MIPSEIEAACVALRVQRARSPDSRLGRRRPHGERGSYMSFLVRLCAACALVVLIAFGAGAQHLYLSDTPNLCAAVGSAPPYYFYIYAHSPDDSDFWQASFRIDTSAFDASDVEFVNPVAGGAILSGDIFSGITVQWTPQTLEHSPVLEIKLFDTNITGGEVWVTDATMYRLGGAAVPIEDKLSIISSDFHCSYCFFQVDAPDIVDVVVGSATTVRIFLGAGCDGALAAVFDVIDTEGWVDAWDPTGLLYPDWCGECFWGMRPVDIGVVVPPDTPPGTLSEVTVANTGTFLARAIAPVAVENTTWGRIKAMRADEE
jgi:hypothetical protein